MRQVQLFKTATGPALKSISTLEISYAEDPQFPIDNVGRDIATLLSSIVGICSLVRTLKVQGEVGAPLLAALGASCKHLTRLEVADIAPKTAERLLELLPNVTSTKMKVFDSMGEHNDYCPQHLLAISACSTLGTLDMPDTDMNEQTWRALPPSIRKLSFLGTQQTQLYPASVPAELRLPSLVEVQCRGSLPLGQLVRLLRAAPKLEVIVMSHVTAPRSVDQIPDLVFLHQRVSAGLTVRSMRAHPQRETDAMILQLTDLPTSHKESANPGAFMQRLPVFERFSSVELETAQPSLFEEMGRVFPRLVTFNVTKLMPSATFPKLAAFQSMEKLTLTITWSKFTVLELGAMCLKIPLLQHVKVCTSPRDLGSYAASCCVISGVLESWGRLVVIESQG